jgi:hypothetical protein
METIKLQCDPKKLYITNFSIFTIYCKNINEQEKARMRIMTNRYTYESVDKLTSDYLYQNHTTFTTAYRSQEQQCNDICSDDTVYMGLRHW